MASQPRRDEANRIQLRPPCPWTRKVKRYRTAGEMRQPQRLRTTRLGDEAARLRRSLQIMSRCSRVLFQARDEQEALQSLCETLVASAQVGFAWIGYAQDDPEKTVRPIAHAGTGATYLERVHHSCKAARNGQNPVCMAIRTGTVRLVKDIRAARMFSQGRDEALALGYRSCVALPLVANLAGGNRINLRGALNIYSETPDTFEDSKVELFTELATHLTCTVGRLRSQESSEAELRLVVDTIPTAAWTARPDGAASFVNQRWFEYTGLRAEDSIGAGWKD